jgi:hypothetical protein
VASRRHVRQRGAAGRRMNDSQTSAPKGCARSQTTCRNRIFTASPPLCRCPHRAMQARCRELGRIFFGMSCRPRIGRSQSGREFVSRTSKSFHIVTVPGQMPAPLGGATLRSMSWPPRMASERYAHSTKALAQDQSA